MSDDLRRRIAEVLQRDAFGMTTPTAAYRQADAIIVELGLRIEHGQRSNTTGPLWGGDNRHTVHRWVTDWKADE
jgi:hypothetical protein